MGNISELECDQPLEIGNEMEIFSFQLEHQTEKAILVMVKGQKMWIPKSQIVLESHSDWNELDSSKNPTIEISLPEWLIEANNL